MHVASRKGFRLKKRYLLIFAGLAIFVLYLVLFVPVGKTVAAVQSFNPFYFSLAFCCLLMSVAFYSLAWQRFLNLLSVKASFRKALQFVWVENFVDLVIPGEPVSGEVSRIYLMSKDTGGNYGKVFASAVGQRIATTCVTVVGLLASIVYFAFVYRPPFLVLLFAGVVLVGDIIVIGLLFYLAGRKGVTQKLAKWLFRMAARVSRGRWKFEHLMERVLSALEIFHEGILTLGKHRRSLVLPLFFTVLSWLSDVSIAILVFLSLGSVGTAAYISEIIIVYTIAGAIQNFPIGVIPGEVGLTEIVMTTLFAAFGNPQFIFIYAGATVLIRILTFWTRLLISGVVVQLIGVKSLMPPQPTPPQNSVSAP
jgi:uncharacterized protein (TIRG00374 family)